MNISRSFRRSEFKCKCGHCNYDTVDTELVDVLQDIRDHFNEPVNINSGNRCPAYNSEVGGSPKSQHVLGRAADISINNVSHDDVQKYLLDKYPSKYGIGCYSNFTHIDTRTGKGRW